jgi:C-terminal of Roc, COR, domain
MLDHILNVEQVKKMEYDPAKEKAVVYSDSEQQYLVKIMQQFELLFEYAKGKFLVPDLLPKEPTMDYTFDESDSEHIRFVLKYDFFPPTLMPRFIIRMKDDVREVARLWRYGVELHPKSMKAQAIVKADKSEKRIDICVCGSTMAKREYFAFIIKTLQDIHSTYEELLGLENMGEDELKIGKLGKKFSISKDFLDKISTKQQRMEEKNKQGDTYNISGGIIANIGGQQDKVQQKVDQSTEPNNTFNISPENGQKMNKKYILIFFIGLLLIGGYAFYKVLNSPEGGKATISTDGVTVEKAPERAETHFPATITYTVQVPIKINGEVPEAKQIGYMRATHVPALTAELTSGGLFTFRDMEIPKDEMLIFELFYKDGKSAGLAQTPFVKANSKGLSVLNTVQFTGQLDKKRNQYLNITVAPEFKVQNMNVIGDGNKSSQKQ